MNPLKSKSIIITYFILWLLPSGIFSQNITGTWNGALDIDGTMLEIIFNIEKTNGIYSASISVPMQGADRIPMNKASFDGTHLSLGLDNPGVFYDGDFEAGTIKGMFKQGGRSIPLILKRDKVQQISIKRKQEPQPPYPYYSEEVKFKNTNANITLSGTLTMPKKEGLYPVIVLISGSGPQNRNEEVVGHKPFLVLSDYFTRSGFAVLRYDDRGVGTSEGIFNKATTADFATDAAAAIQYLKTRKEIDSKRMGLMGHSEGGIVGPMVASNIIDIKFLVLLAAPGLKGDDLLLRQQYFLGKAQGLTDESLSKSMKINKDIFRMVTNIKDSAVLKVSIARYLSGVYDSLSEAERPQGIGKNDFIKIQVHQIASPWMSFYLEHDPAINLRKLQCAVLALNGEKDLQVPAQENLEIIKKEVESNGNKKCTIKSYPELNHLFQHCTKGTPEEYSKIEETFAPEVMEDIKKWLEGQK